MLSISPALLALRSGELAAYHGAEHVSIGTYEHGEKRAKEHERCGSHLIGPLIIASAAGTFWPPGRRPTCAARRESQALRCRRSSGGGLRLDDRHPGHPLAKALAFPGHELQHRIATAEPSPEQLEVAEAALAACLELENGDRASH